MVIVKMADSIATRFRKSEIIFLEGNDVKVRCESLVAESFLLANFVSNRPTLRYRIRFPMP